jgi:hypothetical protein
VIVPIETVAALKPAFDKLTAQEARIIQAARAPGATAASIKAAMKG